MVLAGLPLDHLLQVIVVDNGSTDGTADAALGFAPNVHVVRESRPGYGRACLRGIAAMSPATELVVFIDGDYSDHGEELFRLVRPIVEGGKDFVVGSRVRGRAEPGSLTFPQRFGNRLATSLMWMIWGGRWTDLGPFRAIRHHALKRLKMRDTNYGWTVEMQIKAMQHGLRVTEVPVSYRRRIGKSKISGTVSGTIKAGAKILYTIARYGIMR